MSGSKNWRNKSPLWAGISVDDELEVIGAIGAEAAAIGIIIMVAVIGIIITDPLEIEDPRATEIYSAMGVRDTPTIFVRIVH